MAVLTPLDPAELRALAAAFGLELASARGVEAGSVNTHHELVDAEGRRWFLRIYEEQDRAGAAREHALLGALAAAGVPTPVPRALRDAELTLTSHVGKPVALFPFVEGRHVCQAGVTDAHTERVGAALARIHRVGEGFAAAGRTALTEPSRFAERALLARLDGVLSSSAPAAVRADAARIQERLGSLAEREVSAPELPLVHGDLFRDNVLFDAAGEIAALLDFESASRGTASFDVAVASLAWCFGDDLSAALVSGFFRGYARERELGDAEVRDLPRALELACLRFATTRITDYELRPAGVGVRKDYRRWLARLDAVDRERERLVELAGRR